MGPSRLRCPSAMTVRAVASGLRPLWNGLATTRRSGVLTNRFAGSWLMTSARFSSWLRPSAWVCFNDVFRVGGAVFRQEGVDVVSGGYARSGRVLSVRVVSHSLSPNVDGPRSEVLPDG